MRDSLQMEQCTMCCYYYYEKLNNVIAATEQECL